MTSPSSGGARARQGEMQDDRGSAGLGFDITPPRMIEGYQAIKDTVHFAFFCAVSCREHICEHNPMPYDPCAQTNSKSPTRWGSAVAASRVRSYFGSLSPYGFSKLIGYFYR
jgi:hypothetical protein